MDANKLRALATELDNVADQIDDHRLHATAGAIPPWVTILLQILAQVLPEIIPFLSPAPGTVPPPNAPNA